jgi:hypothetical protein
MSADLKMFRIPLTTTPPSVTMVYAVSKTQAWARFKDAFCPDVAEATALQIQDAVEGKLTILGKPDPGDPLQQPLEGV